MELIDITPLVSSKIAVFPGDTPFEQSVLCSFEGGQNFRLSKIQSTVHLGAHADAPNHYDSRGSDISTRSLDYYFGPVQVIEVKIPRGTTIKPSDFSSVTIQAPRILFKTNSFPDPEKWNSDFNSLSPELICFLASKNVKLVGIDTPSVDLADEKVLKTHHEIFKNDMAILEGLDLSHVSPGLYTLAAFPLKLSGLDASPVRAVLIKNYKEHGK